jgi:hypothetical protein
VGIKKITIRTIRVERKKKELLNSQIKTKNLEINLQKKIKVTISLVATIKNRN